MATDPELYACDELERCAKKLSALIRSKDLKQWDEEKRIRCLEAKRSAVVEAMSSLCDEMGLCSLAKQILDAKDRFGQLD